MEEICPYDEGLPTWGLDLRPSYKYDFGCACSSVRLWLERPRRLHGLEYPLTSSAVEKKGSKPPPYFLSLHFLLLLHTLFSKSLTSQFPIWAPVGFG